MPTKRPTIVKDTVSVDGETLVVADTEGLTIDDPRLDAYRPDPQLVKQYVTRNLPNGQTDIEYLMRQWRKRKNVLLVGDTQGGKTMLVNVLACLIGEELGIGKPVPVFTLSASNGITDFDLFGQTTAWTDPDTGQEHLVWLPGQADLAARVGGIFYLDEVNMMPERVTSSVHPMADYRRMFVNRNKAVKVPGDGFMPEVIKLNDKTWIVGTMNPNYRGAGALNEAFANRFKHLDWKYNDSVERKLIPNEAVRTLGDALRQLRALGKIKTPIGTSALMQLADDLVEDGVEMALYVLKSMFTQDEKPYIDEVVETRSFKTLLSNSAQGLHPLTGSGSGIMDDPENPFG
jgi:MoxR-like ATPase